MGKKVMCDYVSPSWETKTLETKSPWIEVPSKNITKRVLINAKNVLFIEDHGKDGSVIIFYKDAVMTSVEYDELKKILT